jgi:hypothetical protein
MVDTSTDAKRNNQDPGLPGAAFSTEERCSASPDDICLHDRHRF